MRYASIRKLDISNGEGIGISIFVQGCPIHCFNCFNQETWDFNGGHELTEEIVNDFIELANRDQIQRISFLGGEPLCLDNAPHVLHIIERIRKRYGDTKKIWVYTGYQYEGLINYNSYNIDNAREYKAEIIPKIMNSIDVLIDGQYKDELKDMRLHFRGSTNQRVIDMRETIKQGEVVLCDYKYNT